MKAKDDGNERGESMDDDENDEDGPNLGTGYIGGKVQPREAMSGERMSGDIGDDECNDESNAGETVSVGDISDDTMRNLVRALEDCKL